MEEEEQEKKSARKARGFVRPTVEEVRDYCASKGYPVDAEEFCSYYESNGWKVGRNPMKSWKGACTTWAKRRSPRGGGYAEYSQYD